MPTTCPLQSRLSPCCAAWCARSPPDIEFSNHIDDNGGVTDHCAECSFTYDLTQAATSGASIQARVDEVTANLRNLVSTGVLGTYGSQRCAGKDCRECGIPALSHFELPP